MMEQRFREICQREGVTPSIRKRSNQQYLYVSRWVKGATNRRGKLNSTGGKTFDRYVCPASRIDELTEADLMRKINSLPLAAPRTIREPKALDYLFGASDGSDKTE